MNDSDLLLSLTFLRYASTQDWEDSDEDDWGDEGDGEFTIAFPPPSPLTPNVP